MSKTKTTNLNENNIINCEIVEYLFLFDNGFGGYEIGKKIIKTVFMYFIVFI